MSSTDRSPARLLLLAAVSAAIAGCSTGAKQTAAVDNVNVIKPVRAQAAAPAVAASDTTHVTTVTASPQAQAAAQQAVGDYFSAVQMMKAGKLDDAMLVLQQISAQHPMLSGPLVNQALVAIRQEKWEDALEAADQALKINPRNPFAWNLRGIVMREQGKFADARKAYENALAIDPQYAKAHFNLGVLADLYLQDLPLALTHYEKYQSLQRKPDPAVGNWIADLRNRLGIAAPAAPAAPAPAEAAPQDNAPPAGDAAPGTAAPAQAG